MPLSDNGDDIGGSASWTSGWNPVDYSLVNTASTMTDGGDQFGGVGWGDLGYTSMGPEEDFTGGLNNEFLKSIGYRGGNPYVGPAANGGSENGQYGDGGMLQQPIGYTREFKDYMDGAGLSLRQKDTAGTSDNILGAFDKNGKQVGTDYRQKYNPDTGIGYMMMLASMFAGGIGGAGLAAGAGYGAGTAIGGAAAGAGAGAAGGFSKDLDFGDAAKGGAMGAVTGGISGGVNVAGYAGITDPTYANIANKAVAGGINAGVRGNNPLMGAATGGAGAGAGAMWDSFLSSMGGGGNFTDNYSGGFSDGSMTGGYSPAPQDTSAQDFFKSTREQAAGGYSPAPAQPSVMDYWNGTVPSMDNPNANGKMTIQSAGRSQAADPYDNRFMDAPGPLGNMGAGNEVPSMNLSGDAPWLSYLKRNGGGLAQGLAGLYMGHRQANMMGKAQDQLAGLYSANSPYASMMRQRLQRADAAAGRRTQVGARETQLAGALTEAQGRMLTSPQYANLMQGRQAGQNQQIGTLLNLLGNKQTQGMFTEAPGAISSGYDALSKYFGG
jgi:hypothetical protein